MDLYLHESFTYESFTTSFSNKPQYLGSLVYQKKQKKKYKTEDVSSLIQWNQKRNVYKWKIISQKNPSDKIPLIHSSTQSTPRSDGLKLRTEKEIDTLELVKGIGKT